MFRNWESILSTFCIFVCIHGITTNVQTPNSESQIITAGDASIPKYDSKEYGKRPAGHSFVRFGKREDSGKGHSFMYFGKRTSPEERNFYELLQFLQRNPEPSGKRGHSIMRFGKRAEGKHNFIRFGKRSESSEDQDNDVDKKNGHSMMYFGKRNGHSMMYFGKRNGHSMMYFGKRQRDSAPYEDESSEFQDPEKRGHSMMYFGKREPTEDGESRKAGHSMMYFGKREPIDSEEDKRNGHSMMYFGKRLSPNEDEELDKRATPHSMMYFGKRSGDGDKKANKHSMIYFGKRDAASEDVSSEEYKNSSEDKRATHQMIRFGKRQVPSWMQHSSPFESFANRYYSSFISDGKDNGRGQNVDKKKHNMMHFGKRSVEDSLDAKSGEKHMSESSAKEPQKHDRKKREAVEDEDQQRLWVPVPLEDTDTSEMYDIIDGGDYYNPNFSNPYQTTDKKDTDSTSKNVFLRFGKN